MPASGDNLKQRRALLLLYNYPPDSAAGAKRANQLARHLPEFGWEIQVVTRQLSDVPAEATGVSRVREPFSEFQTGAALRFGFSRGRRRWGLARLVREIVFFPDRANGWIPYAVKKALELHRATAFQLLFSSAMPASAHVAASVVARVTGLPWVADFRDPWIGTKYIQPSRVRRAVEQRFERWVMRRAAAMTAVSQSIADGLRVRHPATQIYVVENAADFSEWNDVPDTEPREFRICYTGTLYDGQRSPDILFQALEGLRRIGDPAGQAHVDFFGRDCDCVLPLARERGVADNVATHGAVPHHMALRAQRQSAVLLILLKMDGVAEDEVGSKIFEYVGAHRPILAIGPTNSIVRQLIVRNDLGWFVGSVAECRDALKRAYQLFLQGRCRQFRTIEWPITDGRTMAQRFANIFNRIVHSSFRP
jgi:hypothetical protein